MDDQTATKTAKEVINRWRRCCLSLNVFFFFFRTHRSWRSAVVAENSPRKLQTGDDDRAGIGGIKFSFYVSLFLLTLLSSCARFDSINLLLLPGSLFMPRPSLLGPNRQRTLFVPEKNNPKGPRDTASARCSVDDQIKLLSSTNEIVNAFFDRTPREQQVPPQQRAPFGR